MTISEYVIYKYMWLFEISNSLVVASPSFTFFWRLIECQYSESPVQLLQDKNNVYASLRFVLFRVKVDF